jgi:hypothetical protein
VPDQLFEPEPSEPDDHDVFYDAVNPGETGEPDEPGDTPAAASAADVLVDALLEAGPEAAEHLLKAAQELLLAAKAVVDAGERVIDQHHSARDDEQPAAAEPRVRRIDLA